MPVKVTSSHLRLSKSKYGIGTGSSARRTARFDARTFFNLYFLFFLRNACCPILRDGCCFSINFHYGDSYEGCNKVTEIYFQYVHLNNQIERQKKINLFV